MNWRSIHDEDDFYRSMVYGEAKHIAEFAKSWWPTGWLLALCYGLLVGLLVWAAGL